MPYVRSIARLEFESRLQALLSLLVTVRKPGVQAAVRDSVVCSVIMLTSAHAESYIGGLIADWLRNCEKDGLTYLELPPHLRAFCLLDEGISNPYSHYLLTKDEFVFSNKILDAVARGSFEAVQGAGAIGSFPIGRVLRKKYPSPDNVKLTFKRVGLDGVMGKLSAKIRADAEALLQSFNDVRSAIAHEGVAPPGFSVDDATRQLRNVERIVFWLDHLMFSHVCRSTRRSCWPS